MSMESNESVMSFSPHHVVSSIPDATDFINDRSGNPIFSGPETRSSKISVETKR